MGNLDQEGYQGHLAQKGIMDTKACQVCQVLQGYLDREVKVDNLVKKVTKEPREFQDSQVQVDQLVLLVFLGQKVDLVHQGNQATQVRGNLEFQAL